MGLVVLIPPSTLIQHQKTHNLGKDQLVYNGELEGVTQAVEYANKTAKPGLTFNIYSDNQAGLWRLKTPSDNPGQSCQIRAINAAKQATAKGAKINLKWVPGHTDINGNDKADELAKLATSQHPSSYDTSFAMLGMKIKGMRSTEWKQAIATDRRNSLLYTNSHSYRKIFPWNISCKLRITPGTPREIASAFYQLKIGHGYIKSYLHKLGHAPNDRCRRGAKETAEHLLLSCPETGLARKNIRDTLQLKTPLSQRILMHTTKGKSLLRLNS